MKKQNKRRFIVTKEATEHRFYNEQIAIAFCESVNGHLIHIIN